MLISVSSSFFDEAIDLSKVKVSLAINKKSLGLIFWAYFLSFNNSAKRLVIESTKKNKLRGLNDIFARLVSMSFLNKINETKITGRNVIFTDEKIFRLNAKSNSAKREFGLVKLKEETFKMECLLQLSYLILLF
jgi:poly(3-hydroxyalkanoate) synthetase